MFRIGEFSIIAQVSGRLLRYYDEIGLLSPEHTDPFTGYRYYSAAQLPQLNRILVLKELGLSLDQIAHLLKQDTSVEAIRGMLMLRKAQIEQSLQDEMARLRVVESRLQQIDTHGHMQDPDVVLKAIPSQQFLSVREVLPGMAAVRRLVERIYSILPSAVTQSNIGPIAIVIHAPAFDPDALDFEVGCLITGKVPKTIRLSEERTLMLRDLPAVDTMATVAHSGSLNDTHCSYRVLAEWLERNQWQIIGTAREILIQLPVAGKDNDVVIEIQLPVSKDRMKLGA